MNRTTGNIGQVSGRDAAPQRTSEINSAIEELRQAINRYENLVHRFTDRINAVVTPAPPECTTSGKEQRGQSTQLGMCLDGLHCQLRDITNDLESLYDRIEL